MTSPAKPDESGASLNESLNLPAWARPLIVVVGICAVMWVVELIDLLPGVNLDRWGIRPRTLDGLVGIVTAPFLHDGLAHLISNTIPFIVLGTLIAASSVGRYLAVTVMVALVSGLGTWLIGPAHTDHIGASAVVFGYLTYLLARGFFERKVGYIVVGILVLFFYGGVLWGLLPRPGISWQGHLFGAVGGVLAAWLFHDEKRRTTPAT